MAICLSVNTANRKFSSNLVVLHGSPHRDSHTEKLTYDHLAQYTDGTAIFHFDLFHTPIYPCIDCKYCQTHDGCPIDDPFESIVGKLDEADTIILSTPVYYMGFPAPVKAFMDRTQQLFARRILFKREEIANNKQGVLICTCGSGDLSAIEALRAPSEMFFSVFGAKLTEMVYLAGTDLPQNRRSFNRINFLEKEMSK